MSEAVVELTAASAERGARVVWSGLDLRVGQGELVGVLGPNGAGKSTLLAVLLGRLRLRSGSARVLGRPPGEEAERIGYLPQRHGAADALRVRAADLVRLGLDGRRWGLPLPGAHVVSERARAARRRVEEVLDLVGASELADRSVSELSGGERQRVLIAQALVRRPRLLLLDEPLDGLDLPSQAQVAALVAHVSRHEGVAALLVAHDVNPLLGYLDSVCYLAGGRALTGRPEEVITGEGLTRLYGVPIEVLRASDGRMVVVGSPEGHCAHGGAHTHAEPSAGGGGRPPAGAPARVVL